MSQNKQSPNARVGNPQHPDRGELAAVQDWIADLESGSRSGDRYEIEYGLGHKHRERGG